MSNWEIGLFDTGDCKFCLFSFLCSPCAVASARSMLDNSPFCFNLLCLDHVTARWLIRTAYDIPADRENDCTVAFFCPCCTINQALQTTNKYKNRFKESGESFGNTENWSASSSKLSLENIFCMPCKMATILKKSMDLPWIIGFLCVRNTCLTQNLIRYHYRIKGNDIFDEICCGCCLIGTDRIETEVNLRYKPALKKQRYLFENKNASEIKSSSRDKDFVSIENILHSEAKENMDNIAAKQAELLAKNDKMVIQSKPFNAVSSFISTSSAYS